MALAWQVCLQAVRIALAVPACACSTPSCRAGPLRHVVTLTLNIACSLCNAHCGRACDCHSHCLPTSCWLRADACSCFWQAPLLRL